MRVAAAQGSAEKTDLGVGGARGGASAIGALGAYENTNEGKVVAAAFLNAWNNIILAVRDTVELARDESTLKVEAGTVAKAGKIFPDGEVVRPKLGRTSVMAKPSTSSKVVKVITKDMESIVDGEEQDGFVQVRGDGFADWVEIKMMRRVD